MTHPLHAELMDMLRKCREQFAFYEGNHRAKATKLANAGVEINRAAIDETLNKADVNGQMVKQIDALIGAPGTPKTSDNLTPSKENDQ